MTNSFTTKYVRKPLYVDAVQITEENFDDAVRWCFGEQDADDEGKFIKVRVHQPKNQRQTRAYVGDWILYTERGYKVYTDRAFQTNFDLAEPNAEDPEVVTPEENPAAEEAQAV